jgi:hypothetical protein
MQSALNSRYINGYVVPDIRVGADLSAINLLVQATHLPLTFPAS